MSLLSAKRNLVLAVEVSPEQFWAQSPQDSATMHIFSHYQTATKTAHVAGEGVEQPELWHIFGED